VLVACDIVCKKKKQIATKYEYLDKQGGNVQRILVGSYFI
jgi:hypothetical protein